MNVIFCVNFNRFIQGDNMISFVKLTKTIYKHEKKNNKYKYTPYFKQNRKKFNNE